MLEAARKYFMQPILDRKTQRLSVWESASGDAPLSLIQSFMHYRQSAQVVCTSLVACTLL